MGTTIDQVITYLGEMGLSAERLDGATVVTGISTKYYRDADGELGLPLAVQTLEDGGYLRIFAPGAFVVRRKHQAAFSQACLAIQNRTKLIHFELRHERGHVDPMIEFPLEDAPLTLRQLHRCMYGIVELVDEFYDVLRVAAEQGRFDADLVDHPELARVGDDLSGMLDLMPASVLEAALERAREQGR